MKYLVALFTVLVLGTSGWSWAQGYGSQSTAPKASQTPSASQPSSSASQMPSQSSSGQTAQTAEGELTRVDSQKNQFWIKMADGKEMQFSYSSSTPVQDAAGKAEGLTSLSGSGSQVKVTYDSKDGVNTATKIEIQSRKS